MSPPCRCLVASPTPHFRNSPHGWPPESVPLAGDWGGEPAIRVMAQLLAAGQSDPEHAQTARDCLGLWFAEVARAVDRLLTASPIRELVNVDDLGRAIGAGFIGLELYEGVDPRGAEAALDSLAALGILISVLDSLGPVERKLLGKRLAGLRKHA